MVNNTDFQAAIIYGTKDYDKFVLDNEYNREVDEKHVKKIVKSLNTYGDQGVVFPVVVDNNFKIIDGQHRFTARKQSGKVIYYTMNIELDSKVLGGINDAMKKWSKQDFMEVAADSEIVQEVNNIIEQVGWSGLSVSDVSRSLTVNLRNVLSDDFKLQERQLNNLLRKKPLFVFYMKDLVKKITDKDTMLSVGSRGQSVAKIAQKLAKYGVSLDDIPTGTYEEVVNHLYSKGLIQ